MHNSVLYLIVGLIVASAEAGKTAPASVQDVLGRTNVMVLTLAETIGMAVQNDLGIAYERSVPGISKAQTMEAKGAFDTTLNASTTVAKNEEPAYGTDGLTNKTTVTTFNAQAGVAQPLITGGNLSINYDFVRTGFDPDTSGSYPSYNGSPQINFTQHLLKSGGLKYSRGPILIAKNGEEISVYQFKWRLIARLVKVQTDYWALVQAIEALKVKRDSFKYAMDMLEKNRKQVKAGLLAEYDVITPEASAASLRVDILSTENVICKYEDTIKNIIFDNNTKLRSDLAIVPADRPQINEELKEIMIDLDVTIDLALKSRPDYQQIQLSIKNNEIRKYLAQNQLLPQIDLTAILGANTLESSFGGQLNDLTSPDYLDAYVGLTFSLPVENRVARARLKIARIQLEQDLILLKQKENDIITDVRDAARQLHINFQQLQANNLNVAAAERLLKAEELRFSIGERTSLDVLNAQTSLANAKLKRSEALINYNLAIVKLAQQKGTLLEENGIEWKITE